MKISQIAAQLYTVRDHCRTETEFAASLRRLRAIGYTAVQISGVGPIPESTIVRILAEEGLTCCATHEPSARLLHEPERCIERLQALGCTLTAFPFPDGVDFSGPENITRLAHRLGEVGARFHAAGLTLGYHNHDLEFVRHGAGTALDHIFAETSPDHLVAELDTYWVQHGGGDVVEWCRKLAGRLPFIHLKDYRMTTAKKPEFAELGAGNLDFRRIIPAAERSGCRWFIVEQDTCPGDPFVSLRISFEHLAELVRTGAI